MTLTIQPRTWNPTKVVRPVIKPVIKALDWAELIKGALPKLAKDSRKVLKRVSDGLGVLELPLKRDKLLRSFNLALSGATIGEKAAFSIETLNCSTSIAGTGVAAVETAHDLGAFSLSANQLLMLNIFGFICSCILVIKSFMDIQKTFTKLKHDETWNPVLILAKKICQLILGCFGMAFFFLGGGFASPYLFLGVSTLSLTISITKDIYNYNRSII